MRRLFNPVVLGRGTPMFRNVEDRLALQLLKTQPWRSGVVVLRYTPA